MINTMLAITVCSTLMICSIGNAGEADTSRETIDVPATYPYNWLEKQSHMAQLSAAASIQQHDDGTIVIRNAMPAISTIGDLHNPTEVIAFADLGTRSVLLNSKKDSQVYKSLAHNAILRHGDARVPRFDVVGKMRYCVPVINGQADRLNPVAVLDVQTVRFYLVSPATP